MKSTSFKKLLLEGSILDQNIFFKSLIEKDISWNSGEDQAFNYLKSLIYSYIEKEIKISSLYHEFKKTFGVNLKQMDFFRVILKELENPYKIDSFLTILNNIQIFSERIYKNISQEIKNEIIEGKVDYQELCKKVYTLYDKFKVDSGFVEREEGNQWEKVYENKKWVAIYPKTQKAFIEWSTTLSNGKKESYTKGNEDARVSWCTSRREPNNEWRNYAKNSACFILIKKIPPKIPSSRKTKIDIENLLDKNPAYVQDVIERKYFEKLENLKEEADFLKVNGYNINDVYRRISYKVDIATNIEKFYPDTLSNLYSELKATAYFKYNYDVISDFNNVDEEEKVTLSVNADNCYMSNYKLQKEVDSDVLEACKKYTEVNFTPKNTPLNLYYENITKEEVKEVILISSMFHKKIPVVSDVVFDYIEIAEFVSDYIEKSNLDEVVKTFNYLIDDRSLVETIGFIPLLNIVFRNYSKSKNYEEVLNIILSKKEVANYQSLVGGIILKLGLEKISVNNIFNSKSVDTSVLNKLFNEDREKLYELYEYSCQHLQKEDTDWIFEFICNYSISNSVISESEVEYLEYFEYIIDEGISKHIVDYIKWIILINKHRSNLSFTEVIKEVKNSIELNYDFQEVRVYFEKALKDITQGIHKNINLTRIMNNLSVEVIVRSDSLLQQVLPEDLSIVNNPSSNKEVSNNELTLILKEIDKGYNNQEITTFDKDSLVSLLKALVLSKNVININTLCNIAINNPKFMLSFVGDKVETDYISKFLNFLRKYKTQVVEKFFEKIEEYDLKISLAKEKDYEEIIRKREKRDIAYRGL